MLDACVLTMVRDGEDYIGPCLRVVAPHVKKIRVAVDARSKDKTKTILAKLQKEFPGKIEFSERFVGRPIVDLVKVRNWLLDFKEPWGFIIDSDEYHQDVEKYSFEGDNSYAFQCWAVWNKTHAHKSSSRAIIGRVFRNKGDLEWLGVWGKEKLCRGTEKVFENPTLMPYRYIHFTHLKKDKWREEMGQERVADGKFLVQMPPEIIKIINKIHHVL